MYLSYDNKHRFVIKKNWTQGVLTTGEKVTNYSSTGPPAHGVDDFSCFVNNINLPTYWKNNTGGEYTQCILCASNDRLSIKSFI